VARGTLPALAAQAPALAAQAPALAAQAPALPARAAAVMLLGAVAWGAGCYPQSQCASKTTAFSGGEMMDPDTYETSPFADPSHPWVDYSGQETLVVTFPAEVRLATLGRSISGVRGWVSQSANLDEPGNQFVETSGQLAAYADAGAGGFTVNNETCQEYFARFEVKFYRADAGPALTDAQTE
jgi:hypothetical protein